MTWRELWQSTVTNIKALLGITPPPPPPPAPIVRRKPMALTGTVVVPPERTEPQEPGNPHHPTPQQLPSTIDLTATRPLPPSAPLRTRKPPMVPVDVALDAAAFATIHARAEAERAAQKNLPAPIESTPSQPPALPAPEVTFTRQGISSFDAPSIDEPNRNSPAQDADPYFAQEPEQSANPEPTAYADVGGFEDVSAQVHHNGDGHDDHGNHNYSHDDDEGVPLTTLLESLLFVAPEAVEPRQLAQTLAQPLEVIEMGLAELADYYQRGLRGLRLQRFNNKVQLVTAPVAAPFIEVFLNLDNSTKLSSPALETLAVIAYRQPVTRAQIEAVRGVDCAGVLRSLTQRGLVAEVGRLEGIGRPILYGVTDLFMQHFGLMEMTELPPLEETEADRLWAATVIDEQEADVPNAKNGRS